MLTRTVLAPLAVLVLLALAGGCAPAAGPGATPTQGVGTTPTPSPTPTPLPTLKFMAFAPPSQGMWLPLIIQKKGLDRKHGFVLELTLKPSGTAYTDFAAGTDKAFGSATPVTVARFHLQGANVVLLWNFNHLASALLTKDPRIQTVKDLEGKTVAADTVTTAWALSAWFLKQQGVDLSKVQIVSHRSAEAITALIQGRVDAIVLSPPAIEQTVSQDPQVRVLDLVDRGIWGRFAQGTEPVSLGVGVWKDWLEQGNNRDLMLRLYQAYQEAAQVVLNDPAGAAQIIAAETGLDQGALERTFRNNPNNLQVRPYIELREAVRTVQQAAAEAGQMDRPMTDEELDRFIYPWPPR